MKSLSCVWLFATPWTVAYQAPLSMEFSRQEYWSGLPCPSSGDLLNPGSKPRSPALWAEALPSEPPVYIGKCLCTWSFSPKSSNFSRTDLLEVDYWIKGYEPPLPKQLRGSLQLETCRAVYVLRAVAGTQGKAGDRWVAKGISTSQKEADASTHSGQPPWLHSDWTRRWGRTHTASLTGHRQTPTCSDL